MPTRMKWVKESLEGWRKRPTISKEKAEEIIRVSNQSISKAKALLITEAAKNAANRFVKKNDDYAQEIINKTQLLLKKNNNSLSLTLTDKQLKLLTDALKNTAVTEKAIKEYTDNPKVDENARVKLMSDITGDNRPNQHSTENKELLALFDNNSEFYKLFSDDAKKSISTIKNLMTIALNNHQEEQLKAFDADFKPGINKLLELQQRAEAKILFLSNIARNLRNTDKLPKDERAEVSVESNDADNDENSKFSDYELDQLKDFFSSSGKKVNVTEAGITIKSGVFGFGITEKDSLQVALLGKAKGWKSIVLTVAHSNPDKLNELARNAASAAIKAGFDPDTITIKVKNEKGEVEERKLKDIFGVNMPESLLSTESTSTTQNFKDITSELKQQETNAKKTTAQEANSNNSPDQPNPPSQ